MKFTTSSLRFGQPVQAQHEKPAKKQHVNESGKHNLRKNWLSKALPGAAYVPFIGDGDIAADCYRDRPIYGADIDADRVSTAQGRLPGATIIVADCGAWPFPGCVEPFAVADFDAYAYPFDSFRAFWANAQKLSRVALFFTDAFRRGVSASGHLRGPSGERCNANTRAEKAALMNTYETRLLTPYITAAVAPYRIIGKSSYRRNKGMRMVYSAFLVEFRP